MARIPVEFTVIFGFPLFLVPLRLLPIVQAAVPEADNGRFHPPVPPAIEEVRTEVKPAIDPSTLPPARFRVELQGQASSPTRMALSEQAPALRICYQQALARLPELSGEMRLELSSDGQGSASGRVVLDDIGDWRLVQCVEQELTDWTLPPADPMHPLQVRLQMRPG